MLDDTTQIIVQRKLILARCLIILQRYLIILQLYLNDDTTTLLDNTETILDVTTTISIDFGAFVIVRYLVLRSSGRAFGPSSSTIVGLAHIESAFGAMPNRYLKSGFAEIKLKLFSCRKSGQKGERSKCFLFSGQTLASVSNHLGYSSII